MIVSNLALILVSACGVQNLENPGSSPGPAGENGNVGGSTQPTQVVPYENRWGIYHLDLYTQDVTLIHSSPFPIHTLRLDTTTDRFVFSQKVDGESDATEEIFSISIEGNDFTRITNNNLWDLYPAWSPEGEQIAFLSQRSSSLGIYVMNADGSDTEPLFDTSSHEADIDWRDSQIAFTKDSSIWLMQADGSNPRQITHPPRGGEWGEANLPFGDYDPRISPDGSRVVFERLVDDASPNGNYDLFLVDSTGASESRITQTSLSQGLASWSYSGDQIAYIVAASDGTGQYDLYLVDPDGSNNRNVTPSFFPPQFLCHWVIFSEDETGLYFIGEWWSDQ